ncbi:3-keto-disaccharide hydrolase [Candidatus Laterigemmans baculatus]|uniref:3-keto-disaccharide hydrolase n=1 Tax=Candidatus Laterigemmans baculatus TaxID=2770505 RepID=UPI0013DBDF3A|nr:DUF1080 domain-containing protein [Candidatus Laterigemmans baculatus]
MSFRHPTRCVLPHGGGFPIFTTAVSLVASLILASSVSHADSPPASEQGAASETAPAEASDNARAEASGTARAENWQRVPTADEAQWEVCRFGGDGDVVLESQVIKLGVGDPLTGVICTAALPRDNYELELESRRTSGFDFFCGLTFPVGEGQCSLILGGWAGGIAGLSSIDGEDASENPTKRLMHFDNDRWYRVRIRVDADAVQAWVDGKQIVNQPRQGHTFDIRPEMDPSLPLGVAAFQCDAELRNFRWRKLQSEE